MSESVNPGGRTLQCKDINVKNNVFYLSKCALVGGRPLVLADKSKAQKYDVNYSGNTYIQNLFGLLAEWGIGKDEGGTQKYNYNLYAHKIVTEVLGDKTGVVLPLDK